MSESIKNVFISHIHEDDKGLTEVKDLLKKHGVTARDYSISSDNPNNATSEEYIKSEILAPKIKQCGALIVYITPETKNSEYVNWEIEYAMKNDLKIIGLWARGENGCEVPQALEDYHDAIVGWSGPGVIDALEGETEGWNNPDGTSASPRDIARYSCKTNRVTS